MVDATCKDDQIQQNPTITGCFPVPSTPHSFTIFHLSGAEGSTECGDLQQLHLNLFVAARLDPALEIAGPTAYRQRHPERCGGGVW